MKSIIKVPIYIEIESEQSDRKKVTQAVRNIIQPEMRQLLKERFDLSWLSSSQRREVSSLLGNNPKFRITSESQILKTGVFPNPSNSKRPWEL